MTAYVDPVDLRGYIDLQLFDRDPGELVERAVLDAAAKMPGWVPREGLIEMVLLEGHALQVSELVYAINRLPGAVAEGILRLQGLPRDQGAGPAATATVTFSDDVGRTVLAGTRVQLPLDTGGILFTFDADVVADPGDVTATGPISSLMRTDVANEIPAGADLELLSQHFYVDQIETASTIGGGRLPEDTATWLTRAVQRLARITDTLLLPHHFVAAALEQPGVKRAQAVDLYDSTGMGVPGDDPGHVTLALMGPAGIALSGGAKTDIYNVLRPMTADHLVLHVIDATVTPVDVTVTVQRDLSLTELEVQANVTAALVAFLNPDTWPWTGSAYVNELISVIDRATGVDRVISLDVPAADVLLDGVAPLATVGDITVSAP